MILIATANRAGSLRDWRQPIGKGRPGGAVFLVAERWADAKREHLAGLLAARQALIDHQIGLRNQISASLAGEARRALAALKPIPGVIKKLDQLIAAAIAEHPPFAALAARLDTVRRFAAPHRSEHIIGMSQRIGRRREGM